MSEDMDVDWCYFDQIREGRRLGRDRNRSRSRSYEKDSNLQLKLTNLPQETNQSDVVAFFSTVKVKVSLIKTNSYRLSSLMKCP